ncbi:M10 family metallopeptidase C-terminal domain-containing protein [Mangrovicoccus sp. HB161399]|uniref:M10 family metallopeptidase C-terminal domain-containing protein n=1 Tax=Mangrovicoccus sp. HB161399 TaxID=2720392 RepID=UPI00155265B1|nr:hypothetical protein [Mangrovicoccus sp. HB161399]
MPTTLVGTAYRIDGVEFGPNDVISAGTALTAVEFTSVDPDASDFIVTPRSVIFEGTVNETVLSEAEEIAFFADGVQIADRSPSYEFVSLETDVGIVFGITFSAGGDTYFLPRNDFPSAGLGEVTGDSQIRANGVSFDQLDFGLLPPGATAFEGLVFGSGAIDAPGLGLTRTVIDSDGIAFNPGESTEIDPFNAEVLVTVSFSDGTTLRGVEAYQTGGISFVNNQVIDTRAFAVEVAAVEASGHTLGDIAGAEFQALASHDLSYAEVGFEPVRSAAQGGDPVPVPAPEEIANVISGTAGRDFLEGTGGEDIFFGGAGNDVLTGKGGADVFVFGAEAGNGSRERDVITDFDLAEDVIALEQGIGIRRTAQDGDDFRIVLDGGDRDQIIIRDADGRVLDSLVFVAEDFLV